MLSEWADYVADDYDFAHFPAGSHVLDVGFGCGEEMRAVLQRGCKVVGMSHDDRLAVAGRAVGLAVCRAAAEHLPFASRSFDGVISKAVIPYTDEADAVSEIARVLRPGGVGHLSYHELDTSCGTADRSELEAARLQRPDDGEHVCVSTDRPRLPGFWGDTLYQAPGPLRRYYRRAGLQLIEARASRQFAAAPVFIYHTVRRAPGPEPSAASRVFRAPRRPPMATSTGFAASACCRGLPSAKINAVSVPRRSGGASATMGPGLHLMRVSRRRVRSNAPRSALAGSTDLE